LPNQFQLISEPLRPADYSTETFFPAPAPGGPYGPIAFSTFNGLPANGVWSLYVYDAEAPDSGAIVGGWSLMIGTTGGTNSAPVITDIPDRSTLVNAPATIPFTIDDLDTAAGYLELTALSSNPNLVTAENLVFSGSGSNRTLTVTPSLDQLGEAIITITVSDGRTNAQDNFRLTVTPNLSINSVTVLADGLVRIAGAGEPGTIYDIQASEDLVQWQTIESVTADLSGAFQFQTADPAEYPSRFYRVKVP
jgi:hypothetical protein